MSATYYTLLVRESDGYSWRPEFGSYEREDVEAAAEGYRDDDLSTKIIVTDGRQSSIDDAVAKLNNAPRRMKMFLGEGAEEVELPNGIYWLDRPIPETGWYTVSWIPTDQFATATEC